MATPNFDKSMKEKKKRKANFTATETTLLVDLVEKNLPKPTLRGNFPVQLRISESKKYGKILHSN